MADCLRPIHTIPVFTAVNTGSVYRPLVTSFGSNAHIEYGMGVGPLVGRYELLSAGPVGYLPIRRASSLFGQYQILLMVT